MAKYELRYSEVDGLVVEIIVDCHLPVNDGAFLNFVLEDGTPVAMMANHRVLEVRNLDEAERIEAIGKEEHQLGTSNGGKFIWGQT